MDAIHPGRRGALAEDDRADRQAIREVEHRRRLSAAQERIRDLEQELMAAQTLCDELRRQRDELEQRSEELSAECARQSQRLQQLTEIDAFDTRLHEAFSQTNDATQRQVVRHPVLVGYRLVTDENFDERSYLDSHPDVAADVIKGTWREGREHFEAFGRAEKRTYRGLQRATGDAGPMTELTLIGGVSVCEATFEEAGYLHCNPDVAAAVAEGVYPAGLDHFTQFGQDEARFVRRILWPLSETKERG